MVDHWEQWNSGGQARSIFGPTEEQLSVMRYLPGHAPPVSLSGHSDNKPDTIKIAQTIEDRNINTKKQPCLAQEPPNFLGKLESLEIRLVYTCGSCSPIKLFLPTSLNLAHWKSRTLSAVGHGPFRKGYYPRASFISRLQRLSGNADLIATVSADWWDAMGPGESEQSGRKGHPQSR